MTDSPPAPVGGPPLAISDPALLSRLADELRVKILKFKSQPILGIELLEYYGHASL
jgi:hypothetical protein